jgi:DNA adenine methylase
MCAVIFTSANVKAKTLPKADPANHGEKVSNGGGAATATTCASSPSAVADTPIKPPLKWAGGKRWLVSELTSLWGPHRNRRYVEPFCGGLAAALGLKPLHSVLNDINPHLINFYTHLKRGLEITVEMTNDEEAFYRHRGRFNQLIKRGEQESAEAAQLFYYLNRTCFNGLCRFNKAGEFNVPFGRHNTITYAANFSKFKTEFENWLFTNQDIASLSVEPEDFVYADPPYDVEFTTYSTGGFSWDDQLRTAEWLAAHAGPVVLSNQATARVVELYEKLGFQIRYLAGPRRISCTGDRTAAREILATKGLT